MKSPRLTPPDTTPGAPSMRGLLRMGGMNHRSPGAPGPRSWDPGNTKTRGFTFWMKVTQALCLAIAVCFTLGASDASSRFTDLGHRLMCTCGCSQMLGECNHVGCTESDRMRGELRNDIAMNMTDQQVLDAFAAKYGATVLAAPEKHGFDLVAWIAPFAVFGAALLGTILLVRRWSIGRAPLPADGVNSSPEMDTIRERIRRETGDGGF